MRYTKKRPTKEGYYWVRNIHGPLETSVSSENIHEVLEGSDGFYIEDDYGDSWPIEDLYWKHYRHDKPPDFKNEPLHPRSHPEFAGPIPIPKPLRQKIK